jgi:hypothetical protein
MNTETAQELLQAAAFQADPEIAGVLRQALMDHLNALGEPQATLVDSEPAGDQSRSRKRILLLYADGIVTIQVEGHPNPSLQVETRSLRGEGSCEEAGEGGIGGKAEEAGGNGTTCFGAAAYGAGGGGAGTSSEGGAGGTSALGGVPNGSGGEIGQGGEGSLDAGGGGGGGLYGGGGGYSYNNGGGGGGSNLVPSGGTAGTAGEGVEPSVTITYMASQAPTSLSAAAQVVISPPPHGIGLYRVSATLTSAGKPVAAKQVSFSVGKTTLCRALTRTNGELRAGPQGRDRGAPRQQLHCHVRGR